MIVDDALCVAPSCEKPRYGERRYCNTHYFRLYRHGDVTVSKSRVGKPWRSTSGYVRKTQRGHPLATARGEVYEHRLVLYERVGPDPQPCHWCGMEVIWGETLEADHVDGDKVNNDPSNLVPSCHGCNTRRALTRRWHG